jgi:hypothetical protein
VSRVDFSSCKRPGCPGFIPSLKGVTKADGPSFLGPAPFRLTMRAGVVNEGGPLTPVFKGPRVRGVDARGCREPAVVNAGVPESWLAGLRGMLVPRFPIALCVSRGGLKGFGLLCFAVWSPRGEEIMGLAVIEGREKPNGVGVDGVFGEFSTALKAGRRGDEGKFDGILKAFSVSPTFNASKD